MLFWTISSSVAIPPLKIDNLAADYRAFSRLGVSGYARRDSGNAVPAAVLFTQAAQPIACAGGNIPRYSRN
jgi:hypothetical protein